MIGGQGYEAILQMIMRRLDKIDSSRISTDRSYALPYTPEDSDDATTPYNPYDPHTYSGFEDYDYELIYNDDEDLIGFKSHNGAITYMLNKDQFDDLVSVTVTTNRLTFKIALIYENYDIRLGDAETDDKGKLCNVVLVQDDGTSFPAKLEISPLIVSIDEGDDYQISVICRNSDGTALNVSQLCTWSSDKGILIQNGLITNALAGVYNITAEYKNFTATCKLIVNEIDLIVESDLSVIDVTEIQEARFTAYKVRKDGVRVNITTQCFWHLDNPAWSGIVTYDTIAGLPTSSFYKVFAPTVGIGNIVVTYKGITAQATLRAIESSGGEAT